MPKHIVIDGSNLATEGRSMPSLKQLVEAVQAFMAEHPNALLTVVVDATFGHRIDPREVPEFDAAIDHNELVAPPAGAVGRGDAFVLAIADKVDATILSNDSYQEFHGEYPWLFDEGRLIGGKPVPNVGWVFVPRVPVRGPLSRRSQRDAKERGRSEPAAPRRSKAAASLPKPVPSAPPPGAVVPAKDRSRGRTRANEASARLAPAVDNGAQADAGVPAPAAKTDVPTPARSTMINDLLPFLGFVEHYPVGSTVQAVVESYSSHGAYVTVGDVRAYIPLRFMADPPPRSAREAMKLGDAVTLVVVGFHAQRRGIDLAAPELAGSITGMTADELAASAAPTKRARKSTKATAAAAAVMAEAAGAAEEPPVKPAKAPTARKRAAAKAKTPIDEGGTPLDDLPGGDGVAPMAASTAAAATAGLESDRQLDREDAPPQDAAPGRRRPAAKAGGSTKRAAAAKKAPAGTGRPAATESSETQPSTGVEATVAAVAEAAAPPPPTRRRAKAAATVATDGQTSAPPPAPAKRAASATKRAPARSSRSTEDAPDPSSPPAAAGAPAKTTRSRSKKVATPS